MFESFEPKQGFKLEEHPEGSPENVVYVFFADRIPFYVGQTGRFKERMKDYLRGHHAAPTDFSLKTAITYLEGVGHKITVRYNGNPSYASKGERLTAEKNLIKLLAQEKIWLLNYLPSYEWNDAKAEREEHKKIIEKFCMNLVKK